MAPNHTPGAPTYENPLSVAAEIIIPMMDESTTDTMTSGKSMVTE